MGYVNAINLPYPLIRAFIDAWKGNWSPRVRVRIVINVGFHDIKNFRNNAGHDATAVSDLRLAPACSKGGPAVEKLIAQDVKSVEHFLQDGVNIAFE